ncbi:GPS1 [Cordylochernes scorpioides]|uniref:GPS1 n=1 Tax=Cordylochernes scorpioides TaxID=51811 RepID=A0ABY6KTR9_9ARAC|nr:GPS1 [Cordylochernes scorpioides]
MPLPNQVSFNQQPVEPMQVDVPPEEQMGDASEEEVYIVENTTLDLDTYANSYTGLARLHRLVYIAEHCPSLRTEALKLALSYVQTTYNVALYQQIQRRLNQGGNAANLPDVAPAALDTQWVEARSKKAALKLEKLDTDLKNYKSNSIKESIRRGHDDLGDHYLDCGDLSNALKCYSRARDYCTSGKHIVNITPHVYTSYHMESSAPDAAGRVTVGPTAPSILGEPPTAASHNRHPLPPGASSTVSRQQSRPTPAAPALPMEETPSAPPPVTPAPPLQAPEGPVGPRPAGSQHPEPPPARPDLVAPLGPLPVQKTLGPAAPTPDVEMSIVEETFASSTSSAKNATRVDLDAFIEGHPSVSFAETDALGLGREEVLDLLSSRTKAQRKGPLLSPPQCDALAGLIRHILDLRPGAASNLYKVLGQVKAELRTTPTAVSPTPPLPAPRPAEPTPPAPHGKMTTPALATSPLFQVEEDLTSKRWDEAADIIYKLCNERYSGPLTDLGITEGGITDAVIYPEDREPLLRTCSTQKKNLITEIISAAIERARDSDPFVSVYLQNWSHVLSYVNKAEVCPEVAESHNKEANQHIITKLRCAAGLAELATRKYKSAAKNFLQASFDHCEFPDLLSANNVAVYGGLCALASFDRQELLKNVISSSSFKLFLELEPQLRDIIFKFYNSKYAQCLKLLEEIKDNLYLDMYLASHVNALYTQIRNRALIQYFSPYLSADLVRMAGAFNTSVTALEDELMQLILDNQIAARIDSHKKILYAKDIDQRSTTFQRFLSTAREFSKRNTALVLRAAMLRNHINIKVTYRTQLNTLQNLRERAGSVAESRIFQSVATTAGHPAARKARYSPKTPSPADRRPSPVSQQLSTAIPLALAVGQNIDLTSWSAERPATGKQQQHPPQNVDGLHLHRPLKSIWGLFRGSSEEGSVVGPEMYELIKEAFGDAALSRSRTFEWFSRFQKGREKVNDDQHTGRPRSFRCEENKLKIKELIKSNRRISIKDLSPETGLFGEAVRLKRPERWQNNDWILHVGNARPHTAHVVLQFLAKHSTIQIPHPPYSPDLAPNDFFSYPILKMNLKGRKFDNVDMIQAESKATLRNLSKNLQYQQNLPSSGAATGPSMDRHRLVKKRSSVARRGICGDVFNGVRTALTSPCGDTHQARSTLDPGSSPWTREYASRVALRSLAALLYSDSTPEL